MNDVMSNRQEISTAISSSIADDQEVASISSAASTISCGQHTLKDNYVKARREREIEQEQAELEKKRLQEILDLCIEFQRQESQKTPNNSISSNKPSNTVSQPSSISSSLSSSSTSGSSSFESIKQKQSQSIEEQLISTLPKLTSILNLNSSKKNHKKTDQNSSVQSNSVDLDSSSSFRVSSVCWPTKFDMIKSRRLSSLRYRKKSLKILFIL